MIGEAVQEARVFCDDRRGLIPVRLAGFAGFRSMRFLPIDIYRFEAWELTSHRAVFSGWS